MASPVRTEIKARLLPIMYSQNGDLYTAVQMMLAAAWAEGHTACEWAGLDRDRHENPYVETATEPKTEPECPIHGAGCQHYGGHQAYEAITRLAASHETEV